MLLVFNITSWNPDETLFRTSIFGSLQRFEKQAPSSALKDFAPTNITIACNTNTNITFKKLLTKMFK